MKTKTKEELAEFKTRLKVVWDLQKKYQKPAIDVVSPYPGITVKIPIQFIVRGGYMVPDTFGYASITITDKRLKKFITEMCPDCVGDWIDDQYDVETHSDKILIDIGTQYENTILKLVEGTEYMVEDFDNLIYQYDSFLDVYEDFINPTLNSKKRKETVRISPDYEAEIVSGSKIIQVGCQKVNIDDVRELLKVYEELNPT